MPSGHRGHVPCVDHVEQSIDPECAGTHGANNVGCQQSQATLCVKAGEASTSTDILFDVHHMSPQRTSGTERQQPVQNVHKLARDGGKVP